MKLQFLGTGAGFSKDLGNNNVMIYEDDPKDGYYLIDCGEQTRAKLVELDLIDACKGVFLTHLHSDHMGGLEMMGFWWKFVKKETLPMFSCSTSLLEDLWSMLKPGMKNIQDEEGGPLLANFHSYFRHQLPHDNGFEIFDGKAVLNFIKSDHVPNMESYGVEIVCGNKRHFFTSDQRIPVWNMDWYGTKVEDDFNPKGDKDFIYDIIWHDAQLYDGGKSAVHAFIDDLKHPHENGRDEGLFLMHYNRPVTADEKSDAEKWCGGFVEVDQVFEL